MYVVRRVSVFFGSVLFASMLVFFVMSVLPGDQATTILGTQATDERLEQLREEQGLNRPLIVQYGDWLSGAVTGDLGVSPLTKQEITPQIADRLSITLPLAIGAIGLTVLISFPLGVFAAARHRKLGDGVVSVLSQVGLAIPAFWAGLLLITAFAVPSNRRWFPVNGINFPGWTESFWGSVETLALPAISLAIVQSAIITRYVRSAVLDTLREDYIRTARSKGLSRSKALWKHGLRNAAIPVLTVVGLQFAALFAGTVVIERVFVLPGLGNMLLDAISSRDIPLVQGGALVIVTFILALNLLIDLLYRLIDPRVTAQ